MRCRISDLHALLRGGSLVPACSGRAQILCGGTERVSACDCPPALLPGRLETGISRCTMLLPPPPPSLLHARRRCLGSRLPPTPKSLREKILPTVAIDGHLTPNHRHIVGGSSAMFPGGGTFSDGVAYIPFVRNTNNRSLSSYSVSAY